MLDSLNRPARDLRISITDRCNFRCVYCMPREVFGRDFQFVPHEQLLRFEEIVRLARIFVERGVEKVRITGGEPLIRRGVEDLISMLAAIDGLRDLTLTTNGSLLAEKAAALRSAGLTRLTVSLDSIDDAVFRSMNDVDFPVGRVLAGIEAAHQAGFTRIKINSVVKRGLNEHTAPELVRYFAGTDSIVRFIEYMDVGTTNGWRLTDVVPAAEILSRIREQFTLEPLEANYRGEVARRYRVVETGGEIGIISSVTQPFCGDCTRARLSSEGALFTCLFAGRGHDLRALLRSGATDAEIGQMIGQVWSARADRYSELRTAETPQLIERVEMSHIGG